MHDPELSRRGISQDTANSMGIYGTPQSTYDIERAAAKQLEINIGLAASSMSPPPPVYVPPVYQPTYVGSVGVPSSGGTGFGEFFSKLIKWGCIAFIGVVIIPYVAFMLWLAAMHRSGEVSQQRLDPAYYEKATPNGLPYADTPLSVLYQRHFSELRYGQVTDMTPVQRDALAGAWIRYLENPRGFRRIDERQRNFYRAAFRSHLEHMPPGAKINGWLDRDQFTAHEYP